MIDKIRLGKKIRKLREEKHLSREEFCDEQSELTVRQLVRIEKGESLPTLQKLDFITKKLKIMLTDLIEKQSVILPDHYIILKKQLTQNECYGNLERMVEYEKKIEYLYEHYYDFLPEEEQLVIEVFQSNIDIIRTKNYLFSQSLLEEYLEQIRLKKQLENNDMYIVHLYFLSLVYKEWDDNDERRFLYYVDKLLQQVELWERNFDEMVNIICYAVEFYARMENYNTAISLIDKTVMFMSKNKNYYRKSVLLYMKARLYKITNKEKSLIQSYYQQALAGAIFIEDKVLENNIRQEMNEDLSL